MQFSDWKPLYEEILADFKFNAGADEAAARRLDAMLGDPSSAVGILARMGGQSVTVLGPADRRAIARTETGLLVVADSAVSLLPADSDPPLAIVTDLDGDLDAIARFSERGTVVVVHAHGDNMSLLESVSRFSGPVLGTCQGEPVGSLRNFGGFTDGDRAAFLAEEFGASSVDLVGFDFKQPQPKPGADPAVKKRKLAWAKRLLKLVEIPVTLEGKPLV